MFSRLNVMSAFCLRLTLKLGCIMSEQKMNFLSLSLFASVNNKPKRIKEPTHQREITPQKMISSRILLQIY